MAAGVTDREGGAVTIAAGSLVTVGDARLAHGYEANEELLRSGDSWIGTGRAFVLAALHSTHGQVQSVRELAELGVRAGCEFDKCSSGPVHARTITLKV